MKTLKTLAIVLSIALSCVLAFVSTSNAQAPSAPEVVWTRTYNEASVDWPVASQGTDEFAMVKAPDGNLVYCTTVGRSRVVGNEIIGELNVNLSKVDVRTGAQIWSRLYRPDGFDCQGHDVAATDDGGFIIAGVSFTNTPNIGGEFLVIKTDTEGRLTWHTAFGGVRNDVAYSIIHIEDGYIVCGSSDSFNTSLQRYTDVYLVKINDHGQIVWERIYAHPQSDQGFVVKQTSDGGFIIGGSNNYTSPGGAHLIKTNSLGDMEWERIYGGSWTKAVVQTPDGGFLAPALFREGTGSGQIRLLKVRPNGELEWERVVESPYFLLVAESITPTADGGYVLGGFIQESGRSDPFKAVVIKITSSGYIRWHRVIEVNYPRGLGYENRGFAALQTSDGGYAIGGWSKRTWRSIEHDVFVAKLAPEPSTPFMRGDSNTDGSVDISDAIFTLAFLFQGGSTPPCMDAADANDDGQTDVSDPVFTLLCLFARGDTHFSAPYPLAGDDPTEDGFGCESYSR